MFLLDCQPVLCYTLGSTTLTIYFTFQIPHSKKGSVMNEGKKIAIVAFSYALSINEPNPCNVRIAEIVERIYHELRDEGFTVYIVAQWEVALQLERMAFHVNHVVYPQKGIYLDTDGVWKEAQTEVLAPNCINDVVPVAHRWLQIVKVKQLIKGDGFKVIKRMKLFRDKIGFFNSPQNLQPWTKGPIRALKYAIKVQLSGHRGSTPQQ